MGRADIRPTFCLVTVDADCDLADRQTELPRYNDVPGLMKRGPAKQTKENNPATRCIGTPMLKNHHILRDKASKVGAREPE